MFCGSRKQRGALWGILVLAALLFALTDPRSSRADVITEVGASQIGDNAAKAIHYDPSHFNRTITLKEGPDNGILPPEVDTGAVGRIRQRLVNHTYWAVHYLPKDPTGRDELAVFIDTTTGAILGIYTGR